MNAAMRWNRKDLVGIRELSPEEITGESRQRGGRGPADQSVMTPQLQWDRKA
jgi:hypothetical protein